MADVFDTGSAPGGQFKIPTFPKPKPRPDPAPSPPDEGVDPFGIPGNIPSAEPDQPAPVLLVPSPKPKRSRSLPLRTATPRQTTARPQSAPATLSATLRARLWPLPGRMVKASSAGPQFVGDDAQLAEIEREQVVARKVALRKIPARGVHRARITAARACSRLSPGEPDPDSLGALESRPRAPILPDVVSE